MGDIRENKVSRWYFGGAASALIAGLVHPIDLIKVLLQTHTGDNPSMVKITADVVNKNGLLGLYSGLSAALMRQLFYSFTRFGIYEVCKQAAGDHMQSFAFKAAIAGMAGSIGGAMGNPADLINVRMQNDVKLPPNERRKHITKQEGIPVLFKGIEMVTVRACFLSIGQIAFYDQIKQMLLATGLFGDNMSAHFASSAGAGIVATTITQPLDVMKTRLMNAKPGEPNTIAAVFLHMGKEGPIVFFKGYVPSLVRIVPITVLTFLLLEQMRLNFGYYPRG